MGLHQIDTTTGSLVQKSLSLAWPAVLQAILINFYAFNDFVFVGLSGDHAATAALSSCFAILIIQYTLTRLIPTGGTTLIAQFTGARDDASVARIFRSALSASLLFSLVVAGTSLFFLDWIVGVNNASPEVNIRIGEYLWVLLGSTPAFALMVVVDGAFRARGNMKIPLTLEVASLLLNTFLNWVLVLGNLGAPAMGIEGAAIATAISRLLPGIIGLVLMLRGSLGFMPAGPPILASHGPIDRWSARWLPEPVLVRKMVRIGFFESMSSVIYGAVYIVLNRMAGELGSAAQGGLGAGLRGIEWLGFAFGDGFLVASVTIVGQNLGAGQRKRAWRAAWMIAALSAISCQLVGVVFLLFPTELSQLVTTDPETLAYASEYVHIIGWVMWAVGFEMAFYGAFTGWGRTEITLLVSGLTNVLRLPLAAVLLFGGAAFVPAMQWAVFGYGGAPEVVGEFSALAWVIGGTAVLKALIYIIYMANRRELN